MLVSQEVHELNKIARSLSDLANFPFILPNKLLFNLSLLILLVLDMLNRFHRELKIRTNWWSKLYKLRKL